MYGTVSLSERVKQGESLASLRELVSAVFSIGMRCSRSHIMNTHVTDSSIGAASSTGKKVCAWELEQVVILQGQMANDVICALRPHISPFLFLVRVEILVVHDTRRFQKQMQKKDTEHKRVHSFWDH